MQEKFVVGIDQSTQGTKAILVNRLGEITNTVSLSHQQMISGNGWVSHDGEEIYRNTVFAVKQLMEEAKIRASQIAAVGISNQRETTLAWDKDTGRPVEPAIVWQCSRAQAITEALKDELFEKSVYEKTGIPLSPYFPAAKAAWILAHNTLAQELSEKRKLCIGTIDSWLVFKLTDGRVFKTDYSNASRTQLFNLHSLSWDEELCCAFHVPMHTLACVEDSNGNFGETTFDGLLAAPVPIRCVMGDSHASLFGHGCTKEGMVKATYGTGSSVMMNIGSEFKASSTGLATSLAWGINGRITYVLEGNVNYSGAVVTWLQKDLGLFREAGECSDLAKKANPKDTTYLVPAFSGIGAPYWSDRAKAAFLGMTRTTGRAELIKAGLDCIAYQVTDILEAMTEDCGIKTNDLHVDGGPTSNDYLMQFQSDIAQAKLNIPKTEGLSAVGAAYLSGLTVGVLEESLFHKNRIKKTFFPNLESTIRNEKYNGWKLAVKTIM